MAKFYACPDCGATVQDEHVSVHRDWHDELAELAQAVQAKPAAAGLELEQGWPTAL